MIDAHLLNYLESFLTDNRSQKFNKVLRQRTRHFAVAMEDVNHLHNTSAVMRSCEAFGIQDLYVLEAVNRKRIDQEIALGAQKWVDLHRYRSSEKAIEDLRLKGYQIVATTISEQAVCLHDFDILPKTCFFFGREQSGLSDTVLNLADVHLHIPLSGFTESLNVSVSAAIILQFCTDKLRRSRINWQLSEGEQNTIKYRWIQKTIRSFDEIVARYENEK